ncbi:MAG: hypothetical protein LBT37_07415 [Lactobacillaceae bacterium]|jgi:hypothetical protein|nr:hypothetical protein [Lactobacillaceae bacterium]
MTELYVTKQEFESFKNQDFRDLRLDVNHLKESVSDIRVEMSDMDKNLNHRIDVLDKNMNQRVIELELKTTESFKDLSIQIAQISTQMKFWGLVITPIIVLLGQFIITKFVR